MSIVRQLVLSQLLPKLTPTWLSARPREQVATDPATYVERPGEVVLRPPFLHTGVQLNAFAFAADPEALQRLVDRQLNAPLAGAVDYRVAAPMVVFAHAAIADIRSLHPVDGPKGSIGEIDVAFWVPVVATRTVGGVAVPTRFAWFHPYIWVDTTIATLGGREIYGFPKQTAVFDTRIDDKGFAGLSLTTHVMRGFGPDSRAEPHQLLELRRVADGDEPGAVRQHVDGLLESLQRARVALTQRLGALAGLLEQEVHMVFLKQFRDVGEHDGACYQAITEATATVSGFRHAGFLRGDYELDLVDAASHPVRADLGLGAGRLRAELGFWVDYDFRVDAGREVARR
jgi:hypothetical protein